MRYYEDHFKKNVCDLNDVVCQDALVLTIIVLNLLLLLNNAFVSSVALRYNIFVRIDNIYI